MSDHREIGLTLLDLLPEGTHKIEVLCVGTNNVIADALGPLVGTMLKGSGIKVRGDLDRPLTYSRLRQEVAYLRRHPLPKNTALVSVDASSSLHAEDVGKIRYYTSGVVFGNTFGRGIAGVGDVYLLGITTQHDPDSVVTDDSPVAAVPLGEVYRMAERISNGVWLCHSILQGRAVR